MEYQNPVLTGFYPDPSVCRAGDDYYMVNSTFEYLPGIVVSHSTDLVNWEKIGYCITRRSQMEFKGVKASEGIWAPVIRYHNGKFYVVCTMTSMGNKKNFIVTADNPAEEWSEPIWLEQDGIDPSLFFDGDGSVYLTSNGWGPSHDTEGRIVIQQSRIDIGTGNVIDPPKVISYGAGGRCAEAPHLYKIDGRYFLILAEGGTDLRHRVTIFRSLSPWGPFEPCPHNPILTAQEAAKPELSGTGHGDLVKDQNGNWWMVFLCYRISTVKYHHLGRETALVPVIWENGWPVVPNSRNPKFHVSIPELPEVIQNSRLGEAVIDRFDNHVLGLEWNYIREFLTDYRLDGNGLSLYGNKSSLSDQAAPAFIGRRQCHMKMDFSVTLDYCPQSEKEEAGIAVICSNRAHYDLGIKRKGKNLIIQLHKVVEDMEMYAEDKLPADETESRLFVEADREFYHFGCINRSGEKIRIGSGMTKLLSSEVIWGFTGVYVGMYATGNGTESEVPAKFRNCCYRGM